MKKKILIIDDETPIRKLFSKVIMTSDRDICTAASGSEALSLLARTEVDLILLDLNMPGMDGADTLVEIRKMDPNVPVYIITGFGDAFLEKLKAVRGAGIPFEVVTKPVEKKQLREIVQNALDGVRTGPDAG